MIIFINIDDSNKKNSHVFAPQMNEKAAITRDNTTNIRVRETRIPQKIYSL